MLANRNGFSNRPATNGVGSLITMNSTVKVLVEVSSNIVMATVALICRVTEQSMAGLRVDTRGFKICYQLPPSIKYIPNTVKPS